MCEFIYFQIEFEVETFRNYSPHDYIIHIAKFQLQYQHHHKIIRKSVTLLKKNLI